MSRPLGWPPGSAPAGPDQRVGSTSAARRRPRRKRQIKARHPAATRQLSTDAWFLTCSMVPQQKELAGTENRLRRSTYLQFKLHQTSTAPQALAFPSCPIQIGANSARAAARHRGSFTLPPHYATRFSLGQTGHSRIHDARLDQEPTRSPSLEQGRNSFGCKNPTPPDASSSDDAARLTAPQKRPINSVIRAGETSFSNAAARTVPATRSKQ